MLNKWMSCLLACYCGSVFAANANRHTPIAIPELPIAISNNAVAQVLLDDQHYLVSLMGLKAGKQHQDVTAQAWQLRVGTSEWQALPPVPSSLALSGRLASIAVGLNNQVYLFGGYTVAADHSEVSVPDVYRLDIATQTYHRLADMPVPVDDSVALVYQQRYIYLVSGWHNTSNVDLVQVFDTQTNTWFDASPFPGAPVFGHAGGIVGDQMVICDGVKVAGIKDGRRQYQASRSCYQGHINPNDMTKIKWQQIPHFSGPARYRMAASGINLDGQAGVMFLGGSDNPYNFNGIGYDGVPSPASRQVDFFNLETGRWQSLPSRAQKSMDHRGLLLLKGAAFTIGGMDDQQRVIPDVIPYPLPEIK